MVKEQKSIKISFSSQNSRDYEHIKQGIITMMEKYSITINQVPKLLGISSEKVNQILQNEHCILSEIELRTIEYHFLFIRDGFSLISGEERLKTLIETSLIGEYGFSLESLAKYADVPLGIFHSFYIENQEVENKYLSNICVNLQMLFYVLKNNIN